MRDFPGNYSDFRTYEDSKPKELKVENSNPKEKKTNSIKISLNYLEKKEFKKLEREIKKIEIQKEETRNHFNKNLSVKEVKKYSIQLKNIEEDLELKSNRWFELSEN